MVERSSLFGAIVDLCALQDLEKIMKDILIRIHNGFELFDLHMECFNLSSNCRVNQSSFVCVLNFHIVIMASLFGTVKKKSDLGVQ